MTTLDLLRHGEARALAAGGDAARPLSLEGAQAVQRLGEHLGTLTWRPEQAYASPLLRARQTAALVLLAARVPITPETLPELAPDTEPSELMTVLDAYGLPGRHVLLVSHQPLLGELVSWCVGRPAGAITPGALVRVTFDDAIERGRGEVTMTLRPEQLT